MPSESTFEPTQKKPSDEMPPIEQQPNPTPDGDPTEPITVVPRERKERTSIPKLRV
jgi:hypothetical protein